MSDDDVLTGMLDAAARVLYESRQDSRKWHAPYGDLDASVREALHDEVVELIGEQYTSEEFDRRLLADPEHHKR